MSLSKCVESSFVVVCVFVQNSFARFGFAAFSFFSLHRSRRWSVKKKKKHQQLVERKNLLISQAILLRQEEKKVFISFCAEVTKSRTRVFHASHAKEDKVCRFENKIFAFVRLPEKQNRERV